MTTEFTILQKSRLLLAIAALWLPQRVSAIEVDWLSFTPGVDRTHFSLNTDAGVAFAQAELQITTGVLGPLSPAAGLLQAPFWVTPPAFTDSQLGNATIATTRVQVAPQAGAVRYQLTITGFDLSGMVFSVGELFGTAGIGTREVNIAVLTAGGTGVPVSLLETAGWDNGTRFYTEPLSWDAGLGRLSLNANASGESAFSFFGIPQTGTPVTKLTFNVPNGYNVGPGDAVQFAFARPVVSVVPEPGGALLGAWLLGFSGATMLSRPGRVSTGGSAR